MPTNHEIRELLCDQITKLSGQPCSAETSNAMCQLAGRILAYGGDIASY